MAATSAPWKNLCPVICDAAGARLWELDPIGPRLRGQGGICWSRGQEETQLQPCSCGAIGLVAMTESGDSDGERNR